MHGPDAHQLCCGAREGRHPLLRTAAGGLPRCAAPRQQGQGYDGRRAGGAGGALHRALQAGGGQGRLPQALRQQAGRPTHRRRLRLGLPRAARPHILAQRLRLRLRIEAAQDGAGRQARRRLQRALSRLPCQPRPPAQRQGGGTGGVGGRRRVRARAGPVVQCPRADDCLVAPGGAAAERHPSARALCVRGGVHALLQQGAQWQEAGVAAQPLEGRHRAARLQEAARDLNVHLLHDGAPPLQRPRLPVLRRAQGEDQPH
mmetsp:Transcript_19181/g.73697  ORF Transcript_19181/g.73697 Transcript_19181/m.73697 type:complete len:259 (+) Transcript_19181:554-1330(+)